MTVWAVVPVRPLAEGKSRLAPVLAAPERRRLNRAFLETALAVAAAVVGPARTLVVSRCPEALAIARAAGAETLAERGEGHNAALAQAGMHLARRGSALLAVSADLPLVRPADLRALIRAAPRGPCLVLAPNRAGTGTNALLVRPASAIAFRFGRYSRTAHLREARRRGLAVRTVARPGLAFDVDTPADYARLSRRRGASPRRRSAPSCRAAPRASGSHSRA